MGLVTALWRYETDPRSDANKEFAQFQAERSTLSRAAWDRLAERVCKPGAISKRGIELRELGPSDSESFRRALAAAPATTIRRGDYAPGYYPTLPPWLIEYLNKVNAYRALTPDLMSALHRFLDSRKSEIEQVCGHPWRVGSTRAFYLKPNPPNESTHLDGWPVALKKLFILPAGADAEIGSTFFKLKTGEEAQIECGPSWMMFENSIVAHTARSGPIGMRPTIELDILPAVLTDSTPRNAGINGWYPWFPSRTTISTLRAVLRAGMLLKLWGWR